jgi:hypothetical protein
MSLLVQIAAEFVGKKQFKEADKAVDKLTKSVQKLAGAAGIGLSTAALIKFGKEGAKAFVENEKSARRLAISVKNLGLSFETPRIERFLDEISRVSGIEGERLRAAFQTLIQTTGSVTKSQELLNQALDISAGSGVELETVSNDLSASFLGNNKGLSKYSLGLTKAELKTMKFAQVQEKLNEQFSGANADYLDTYAGKFQVISEAADNAQEIIGGALVESLVSAFAAGDPEEFVAKIEGLATKIASMVATAVFGFKKLYYATSDQAILASLNPFDNYENDLIEIIDMQEKMFRLSFEGIKMGYLGSMPIGIYASPAELAARRKAEADALKRQKDLAAAQTKSLAEAKKKAALDKASKTLNLDAIGIEAALKGKISETDRLSLLLQKSILEGNGTLATQLADQLDAAVKRNNALQAALLATPEAPNPYRNWTLPTDLLNYTASSLGVSVAQLQTAPVAPSSTFSDAQMELMAAVNSFQGANQQAINIEVYLDGDAVGGAVRESSVNSSLSGSFNTVNRVGRFGLSGTQ